jgi:hypothetical protein
MHFSELIAHFADHAPGFARRIQRAGLHADDLRAPVDLAALPVMRREDLRALQAAEPPFPGVRSRRAGVRVPGAGPGVQALRRIMARFSEVVRFQAVIARTEDEDGLMLRVVPVHRVTNAATLPDRLSRAVHDSMELLPEVEIVDASELAVDAPPVVDLRSWK